MGDSWRASSLLYLFIFLTHLILLSAFNISLLRLSTLNRHPTDIPLFSPRLWVPREIFHSVCYLAHLGAESTLPCTTWKALYVGVGFLNVPRSILLSLLVCFKIECFAITPTKSIQRMSFSPPPTWLRKATSGIIIMQRGGVDGSVLHVIWCLSVVSSV